MTTWAGVVRVSHMGVRRAGAANVHTDRDQVEAIQRAVPKGDRVVILPPELDVSGALPLERRPSLRAAVEGVERGEFAGIIVAYLSRLGRNLAEQLRTYDRVHTAGGQIIVAQEGIDARTRSGRLQRNILAAIHEDEREQHVERFDNLRRWATEAGIWQRRQTPIGYDRDLDTRKLVPNKRAPEVFQAFRDAGAGVGVTQLSRQLKMTPSGVRQMLRNRVYRGELKVGDYVNRDAHPAIMDEETWLAAQATPPVRPPRG
ncbi:MAG TPA: recombinase family protein, partial [Solirubrobacteraceae bacterium]|nr:recombinase family protein [Solirubrobacteraceae bacterium]